MKVRDIAAKYGFDRTSFEVFAEGAKMDGSLPVHGWRTLSIEDDDVEKAVELFRKIILIPYDEEEENL